MGIVSIKTNKLKKAKHRRRYVQPGVEPGTVGWQEQAAPLIYGGQPFSDNSGLGRLSANGRQRLVSDRVVSWCVYEITKQKRQCMKGNNQIRLTIRKIPTSLHLLLLKSSMPNPINVASGSVPTFCYMTLWSVWWPYHFSLIDACTYDLLLIPS